ncbi:amidohydrolase [Neobacillus niacini]|uniref:amidohydrolase n=1 Tax=Neobacillus niacini TaxID=86668 RepID=UPI00285D3F18|nr:amidohydrolase [Neobacillus niacini]MDR7077672.1 amidohydrolase [Neobacillus niacini]
MNRTELESHLISIRRHLHQYPELSNEEFETTKSIQKWLEEEGIDIRGTGLSTGVVAEIEGEQPGPIVAIRADIDALPIVEKTGLPYASKIKGKMHACGHDFHTAASIGAAYLLKEAQSELKGTVRIIFQPAEESGGGAQRVIKDGHLDGVEAIIGLHNKPDLPVGTIGLKEGPMMAAVDRFHIVLYGKGSHAGIPQNGKDPIVAAGQLITALQTVISRNVSPLQSAVLSVTKIAGGNTWNVIPGDVTLEGTIRSYNTKIRKDMKARFYTIVEAIATAFSQKVKIDWFSGPPPLVNHKTVTEIARKAAKQQSLQVIDPEPSMAGEDFSYYLQHIPGTFAFFGTNGNEEWHHPAFTLDESALINAAYFLYESSRELLEQHSFVNNVSFMK